MVARLASGGDPSWLFDQVAKIDDDGENAFYSRRLDEANVVAATALSNLDARSEVALWRIGRVAWQIGSIIGLLDKPARLCCGVTVRLSERAVSHGRDPSQSYEHISETLTLDATVLTVARFAHKTKRVAFVVQLAASRAQNDRNTIGTRPRRRAPRLAVLGDEDVRFNRFGWIKHHGPEFSYKLGGAGSGIHRNTIWPFAD